MLFIGADAAEAALPQQRAGGPDALAHVRRGVGVRADGDELAAAVPVEGQDGPPLLQGAPPAGVDLHAPALLHSRAQDGPDGVLVAVQGDGGLHIAQGVDEVGQHVVKIRGGQQSQGGKVVVQGIIAGLDGGEIQEEQVGAAPFRREVVDRAQDEVGLRAGTDGRSGGRIQMGHAQLQAQLEGETLPGGGEGLLMLGHGGGPVVALRRNPIFVEEVEVVGDAQLVQARVCRRLRQLGQGGVGIKGEPAVGVIVGQIHTNYLTSAAGRGIRRARRGATAAGRSHTRRGSGCPPARDRTGRRGPRPPP